MTDRICMDVFFFLNTKRKLDVRAFSEIPVSLETFVRLSRGMESVTIDVESLVLSIGSFSDSISMSSLQTTKNT